MRRHKSEQGGSLAIKKDRDVQVWLRESIPTTACILLAPLIGMCLVQKTRFGLAIRGASYDLNTTAIMYLFDSDTWRQRPLWLYRAVYHGSCRIYVSWSLYLRNYHNLFWRTQFCRYRGGSIGRCADRRTDRHPNVADERRLFCNCHAGHRRGNSHYYSEFNRYHRRSARAAGNPFR